MGEKSSYVFLKDPENAWIPAKLISQQGDVADVEIPMYADEQSMWLRWRKDCQQMG